MKRTLAATIALAMSLSSGCGRDARFEIVLPDAGFDLAVVALIDADAEGSPLLAFTPLMHIDDGATLTASRPADGAVRVVAFLYDSLELSSALLVQLSDLPDGVVVDLAADSELPLEPRSFGGDRVSERFLPTDTITPVLPATTAGSVEERIAGAVADQLGMTAVAAQGYLPVEVTLTGAGAGTVTSDPAGIDCPDAVCTASFLEGTSVLLTASAAPGSVLIGWSSDCSGTGNTCNVVLSNPRNATARFEIRGALSESTSLGGDALELPTALDVADDGRIAVAGTFSGGEMRAGGFMATAVDAEDAWIASLHDDLSVQWIAFAGGTNTEIPYGVAFDDAGDVYAAGNLRANFDLPDLSLASDGGIDLFLVKLNRGDGTAAWGYAFGDAGDQVASDVLIPVGGPVLLLGHFAGCIDLDFSNCSLSSSNGTDGFLAAYDVDGSFVGVEIGGGGPDGVVRPQAVAVDPATGSYAVASMWDGDAGFGDDDLSLWGTDFAGNSWLLRYGGVNEDRPYDVAVDPANGGIVVVGHFAIMTDLGIGDMTFADRTGFVARYDPVGNALWAFGVGGTGPDQTDSVAVAANGDLLVAGTFSTSVDLGCGLHTTSGGTDVFVGRLDSNGVCLWSRSVGGPLADTAVAVAEHTSGDILLLGSFQDSLVVDGASHLAMGSDDVFLLRLYP